MQGWLLVVPKSKLDGTRRSSMGKISEGGESGGPTGIAVVGVKSEAKASW